MINKSERIKRIDSYIKKTHHSFISSLKLAEDMSIVGNGALSGKTTKNTNNKEKQ